MSRFAAPIAEQIWDMKYRFKQADGTAIDHSVEDSWRRIARATAACEAEPEVWEERFYAWEWYASARSCRWHCARLARRAWTDRAQTARGCHNLPK